MAYINYDEVKKLWRVSRPASDQHYWVSTVYEARELLRMLKDGVHF